MEFVQIGTVSSTVSEAVDEGWGEVVANVRLMPEYRGGLKGLEGFTHAIIVFWMHEARFDPASDLVRRPRGLAEMPELGIFAQRARHRPNPIGVTAVRIVSVEEDGVVVRGLDAIDGTPVLDIKPYVPVYDERDDAKTPEWIDRLMEGYF